MQLYNRALSSDEIAILAGASVQLFVDDDGKVGFGSIDCDGVGIGAYTVIQDAVDAASSGDTIKVCPGTYTEDLSITTDDLELAGSGSGTTTIVGVDTVPALSFPLADPNIDIKANDVSIHGFTIKSPAVGATEYSSGIVLTGTGIEIFENDFLVGTGDVSQGIQTWKDTNAPVGLRDISGLYIHDNTFSHLAPTTGFGAYEGIYINTQFDAFDATDSANAAVVEDNDFSGELIRAVTTERSGTVIKGNVISTDHGIAFGSFPRGIQLQEGDTHLVTDNVIGEFGTSVFFTGILVRAGVTDSVIGGGSLGNRVELAGTGIHIEGDSNEVFGNSANGNSGDGLRIDGDMNKVFGNKANGNSGNGLRINGDMNDVFGNMVRGNDRNGLRIDGDMNDVFGNMARRSVRDGLLVTGDNNEVHNNLAMDNVENGIHVDGSSGDGNNIDSNTVRDNGLNGILVSADATGNTLTGNTARSNGEDGIHVEKGPDGTDDDNDLFSNNAHHNNDDGIENNGSGQCPTSGPNRNKANANSDSDFVGCP